MSRGSWDGVAQPDADRGDVDGALVNALALVERVATARNCLSLLKQRSTVLRLVYQEASNTGGRPPARPRSRRCFFWSSLTGITALMAWRSQPGPVRAGGIRLIRHRAAGPPPWPSFPAAADPDRIHQRDEPRGVTVLAAAGQPRDRAAAQVSGQVDLGGQPAAGPADRLPAGFIVIR